MAEVDEILYEKLRSWRQSIAREKNYEVYMVLQNKALEEIAEKKPSSETQLLSIKGVGPRKIELYGEDLLNIITEHVKNPSASPKTNGKKNMLEAKVLRVRLAGEKSNDPFQSIWLENERGSFVLLLLGENINRFKKDDRLLIKGYTITRTGPPAFMKLLKNGEIDLIKTIESKSSFDITYVEYSDEEISSLFTQKNSRIVKHGKLNYIRLKGLVTMPKSETDIRYTIYLLKQEGSYILQVSNGFKKHHFKSSRLENLEKVAEDEDQLYEIIHQTIHSQIRGGMKLTKD